MKNCKCVAVMFALAFFSCLSLSAQQIAFTMDDLPAHGPLPPNVSRSDVARSVLQALSEAGLPPTYGFINGADIEQHPGDATVLDEWQKHGNLLGNHTWSHMDLNKNTAEAFEADLAKNEPLLASPMANADWRWLRFPFLSEGNSAEKKEEVRRYLAAHDYRIAAVTMNFGDYMWNDPYARCMAKGDTAAIASLETSYLGAAKAEAQFEVEASRQIYGRTIPFVLLMHIGAFDARMLPRLLAQYKAMGFSFISLEAAERDPFYASDVHPADPAGPPNLLAAADRNAIALTAPRPPAAADLMNICK